MALAVAALSACDGAETTAMASPAAASTPAATGDNAATDTGATSGGSSDGGNGSEAAPARSAKGQAVAVFAGGCFWCMEPPYDETDGVISTTSGYIGGSLANPTYEQVSAGGTGHAEAVKILYDPSKVTYQKLLDVFWHNIDPVAQGRQFCDVGDQYRSAIFPTNAGQRQLAEAAKKQLQASGRLQQPIATTIEPTATFYPAEEYHQDYYEKNPVRYKFYRFNCGRDARLEEVWGESPH